MIELPEQTQLDGLMRGLLRDHRIVCVVEPASSVPQWLGEAGASCVSLDLWSALADDALRTATRDAQAVVVDLDLGIERALRIAEGASAACGVLCMADGIDAAACRRISRPCWSYRSKHTSREDLLLAVRRLGRLQVPDMARLAARAVRMWSLPPQQARILYYNLWSYSDQDIADALDVSIHTVQEYQEALRRKTGARSKRSYLARLLEVSGIDPPLPRKREPQRIGASRYVCATDDVPAVAARGAGGHAVAMMRSLEG